MKIKAKERDIKERINDFEEVDLGYTEEEALQEASRCLNCENPSCIKGCPIGVNIHNIIVEIKKKKYSKAHKILLNSNPLGNICGRVCPKENQCELNCVLAKKNEPISMGHLERFVAERAEHKPPKIKKNKKKVAVIGSGPAGLTCAHELALKGYNITVFEALHKPGGVLTYGIPDFRLPNKIVDEEIEKIKTLGVEFKTNIIVGKTVTIKELERKYDAVFIATGAGLPFFMNIPGENLAGVYSANEFLTRINLMQANKFPEYKTPVKKGKKTVVVGGGNVAIDAARTALRLGKNVTVIYRRSFVEMSARPDEIRRAKEEGVKFLLLTQPIRIIGNEGKVCGIECIQMMLGEDDETGRKKPLELENSDFIVECDEVIVAIGQGRNPLLIKHLDVKKDFRGNLLVNNDLRTSDPKIFAGGDIVSGSATVINAIADGKKAAEKIDESLK